MCEDCKKHEINPETDFIEEEEFALSPLLIGTDDLAENVELDIDSFQQGLDDISYICGTITGLANVGISPIDALNYLINGDILKNNIEITKINKEAQNECAKNQAIQIENNSL